MKYIIIIIILLLLFFNKQIRENFSSYTQCERKKLNGITKEIFNQNNIIKNTDEFDLYMPCGYNKVEGELTNLNFKNKKIYALKGCDRIVSKSNLWTILETLYGRETANKIMPETYLYNSTDLERFKQTFNGESYILKNNKQRKKGITISNNLNEILTKNNNKLIQQFKHSLLINKRKFNLRMYFLVVCKKNKKKVYIHPNTKCLYTSKNYDQNNLDFDSNITNSYKTNLDIYKTNPFSLQDLYTYLEKDHDVNALKNKIDELIYLFSKAIIIPLCNLDKLKNNTSFQLFGIDILIDKNLDPFILEVNKGPDMTPKDDHDKIFKKKVLEDVFDKLKIIKTKTPNLFKRINTN